MFNFFKKKPAPIVASAPFTAYVKGDDEYEVLLLSGIDLGACVGWLQKAHRCEHATVTVLEVMGDIEPVEYEDSGLQELDVIHDAQLNLISDICKANGTSLRALWAEATASSNEGQFVLNPHGFYMSIDLASDISVDLLAKMKCKVFDSEAKLMTQLAKDGREEEDASYIIHIKGSAGDYHMSYHNGWMPFDSEDGIHLSIAQFEV